MLLASGAQSSDACARMLRNHRLILAALFLFALAVRIAHAWQSPVVDPDAIRFVDFAQNLLHQNPFEALRAPRPPRPLPPPPPPPPPQYPPPLFPPRSCPRPNLPHPPRRPLRRHPHFNPPHIKTPRRLASSPVRPFDPSFAPRLRHSRNS